MIRKMKSVAIFVVALGIVADSNANAPLPPSVLAMLKAGTRTGVFAEIVKKSGIVSSDFGPEGTTFLVARDSSCTPEQKKRLIDISKSDDARKYVLNHAIRGILTILKNGDKTTLASYFPAGQPGKRQIVDESHDLTIQSIGGDKISARVVRGNLYLGNAVALEGMIYGGSDGVVIEVDRCGEVVPAKE